MIHKMNTIVYNDYSLHVIFFEDKEEEGYGVEVISEDIEKYTTLISSFSFGFKKKIAEDLYEYINYYSKKDEGKLENLFSLSCNYPDQMKDFEKIKYFISCYKENLSRK